MHIYVKITFINTEMDNKKKNRSCIKYNSKNKVPIIYSRWITGIITAERGQVSLTKEKRQKIMSTQCSSKF